ncbi:uncharacterized protein EV422DRAFT_563819 [Fimicolochytrium jonesii]|uniref:uncharacterized protein n=1 Tax=Fimicolochytrium jonesii TaxID=1396493 RepID=UPI0022FE7318|nr:uncharacterized protein EV422DRAFT_563819 [Fimicolochytrium jonesii]KAI8826004.1 hypothetical protein EV422DRAFT_563819 [Fimicolochytrium jonesii]
MRLSVSFLATFFAFLALCAFAQAATPNQYKFTGTKTASDIKRYIVSFKETATTTSLDDLTTKVKELGGDIINRFSVIPAIVVDLPAKLATALAAIPGVDSVEEDQPVNAMPGKKRM